MTNPAGGDSTMTTDRTEAERMAEALETTGRPGGLADAAAALLRTQAAAIAALQSRLSEQPSGDSGELEPFGWVSEAGVFQRKLGDKPGAGWRAVCLAATAAPLPSLTEALKAAEGAPLGSVFEFRVTEEEAGVPLWQLILGSLATPPSEQAAPAGQPEPQVSGPSLTGGTVKGGRFGEKHYKDTNAQPAEPATALDWPLPCDVQVGNMILLKGVKLETLVKKAQRLFETLYGPPPTPEEAAHNLAVLQGKAEPAAAPQSGPNVADIFSVAECLCLARSWTEGLDLDNQEQWRSVVAVLANEVRKSLAASHATDQPGLSLLLAFAKAYRQDLQDRGVSESDMSEAEMGLLNMADLAIAAAETVYQATEQPAEPDMRAICGALGFDPTNHHNAAKCPYCRPADQPADRAQRDELPPLPGPAVNWPQDLPLKEGGSVMAATYYTAAQMHEYARAALQRKGG